MIKSLQLMNFTAFTQLSNYFSPGISIGIGENGAGKPQLRKANLALDASEALEDRASAKLASNPCLHHHPHSNGVGIFRREGTQGSSHAVLAGRPCKTRSEPSFQGNQS